ncbi:MAG: hemerythrin, partial [Gammaproteobacteria bacterium]|nr:hemerythrin [Gammaproteobacteria bacterium]
MEKIIWNEKVFSVGHPLMDEQHRILVGLINQFIDLSSSGVTPKEIQ